MLVLSRVPEAGSRPGPSRPRPRPPTQRVPRYPPVHSQAAEKGGILSRWARCIPQGLKPGFDSAGFMPGMNPRPTARIRFSSACWGSGCPAGALREWKLLPVWRRPARNSIEFGKLARRLSGTNPIPQVDPPIRYYVQSNFGGPGSSAGKAATCASV